MTREHVWEPLHRPTAENRINATVLAWTLCWTELVLVCLRRSLELAMLMVTTRLIYALENL